MKGMKRKHFVGLLFANLCPRKEVEDDEKPKERMKQMILEPWMPPWDEPSHSSTPGG
jgi:hypothetical protein